MLNFLPLSGEEQPQIYCKMEVKGKGDTGRRSVGGVYLGEGPRFVGRGLELLEGW